MVLKLHKSIYSLKQASRQWYHLIDSIFKSLGFTCLQSDHSIYLCRHGDIIVVIALYVDDLLGATNDKHTWNTVKAELSARPKMKDLGVASYCLGLEIDQDLNAGTVHISQRKYFQGILERFGMADCRVVSTPFPIGMKLTKEMSPKTNEERQLMVGKDYLGVLGCVMYGMLGTCPNLAFPVGVGSRFSSDPGIVHWDAMMHLLRYIKGTLDLGITYRGPGQVLIPIFKTLSCYTDADWAGDKDKMRSTSGTLVLLAGGAVSSISRLQSVTAQSTMEAEYIAASHSGREVMFVRSLLGELMENPVDHLSLMHCDNQSAISVAENPAMHNKAKHIALKYHYIRDFVDNKDITIHYCQSGANPADLLTKILPCDATLRCRCMISLD